MTSISHSKIISRPCAFLAHRHQQHRSESCTTLSTHSRYPKCCEHSSLKTRFPAILPTACNLKPRTFKPQLQTLNLQLRFQTLGARNEGQCTDCLALQGWGSGLRVWVLGFRVWGLGLKKGITIDSGRQLLEGMAGSDVHTLRLAFRLRFGTLLSCRSH